MTIPLRLVSLIAISTIITACGESSDSDTDTTTPASNSAPTVNAGTDQSAQEGASVQLTATGADADGDTISYSWSQSSGTSVTLSSTTTAGPTFTAPDVTSDVDLTFSVTVSDGSLTATDSVVITITDSASTTGSSADDQVSAPGLTATLISGGTAGDTIAWTQTAGTTVTLSDTAGLSPTFTVPSVTADETLTFQVTVNSSNETRDVHIYVPASYTTALGLTVTADFTDKTGWACDVDSGTASATVADSGSFITVSGNGIPDFAVGTFPNGGNPNTISSQNVSYQVTTSPAVTTTASDMQEFGVLKNGIKLERDTAERYSGSGGGSWSYEAITPGLDQGNSKGDDTQTSVSSNWLGSDCNNSHVQPTGQYHSHGLPIAYLQKLVKETPNDMVFAGYAADGFPMYLRYGYTDPTDASSGLKVIEHSWELRSGTRADGPGGAYDGTFREDWEFVDNSGDTDQCGGRTGVTPEHPGGTYHYFITDDYPYIPRCVFGTPDSSFRSRGGG